MDEKEKSLADLVDSLNNSIDDLRKDKIPTNNLPSNLSIMLSGVSDQIGIQTLFSPKVDSVLNGLFDNIMSGKFDSVISGATNLNDLVDSLGDRIGENYFKGDISKRLLGTISNSINSQQFVNTKSKMKKALLVIKDVKQEGKTITDKGEKKKFDQAVYALKKTMKVAITIYKQRKKITDRVIKGLKYAVA